MQKICRKLQWVRLLLLIVGSFTLSGCEYFIVKAYLERERAKIYLTEDVRDISGCELVKHVTSKGAGGGLMLRDEALERVISNLTHDSVKAGANILLIRDKSKGFWGSSASGDAYICKEIKFTSTMPDSDASTKIQKPTATLETQTKPVAQPAPASEDVVEKLMKLKKLKDDGILTEKEYIEKRKALVDKL